jgi:hypothetical protein
MRRPASLSPFTSILTGLVLLAVALGANTAAQEATPGTTPSATYLAEHLWPPTQEVNGEGTPLPMPYVTLVTMPPGSEVDDGTAHGGTFVLTVSEGAICYHYPGAPDPTETTVIAHIVVSETAPAGCQEARTDCEINADCILAPGDVVYLTAGSWITQSNLANHRYWTVGSVTAVVYVSGYWVDPPGTAPCGGGCPHP